MPVGGISAGFSSDPPVWVVVVVLPTGLMRLGSLQHPVNGGFSLVDEKFAVDVVSPSPTEEAWEVYKAHSRGQFNREVNRRDFEHTFYEKAVPTLQSEYRFDGKLIGLGFLDTADEGISSAYFYLRTTMGPILSRCSQRVQGGRTGSGGGEILVLHGVLGVWLCCHESQGQDTAPIRF